MFKKILSKVGIGAATVNLVLDQQTGRVGEEVTGTIILNGGSVDQQIDAIFVNLDIEIKKEDQTLQRKVDSVKVATNVQIKEGANMEFPFRYVIPEMPQSTKFIKYHFHTELDIPGAIDKHDFDAFRIEPRATIGMAQNALKALGFVESLDSGEFDGHFQEFEYHPTTSDFKGRISEIEVIYLPVANGVELHVEIDKRGRGLGGFIAGALDLDEQYATLFIPNETLTSLEATTDTIVRFLEAELNNTNPNRVPTLPRKKHKLGTTAAVVGGFAIAADLIDDITEFAEDLGLDGDNNGNDDSDNDDSGYDGGSDD